MNVIKRALGLVLLVSIIISSLASCSLFIKQDDCKHEYSTTWSFDENNHWREPICDHVSEKKNEGAHFDSDADNKCDTCGYEIKAQEEEKPVTPKPTVKNITYTVTVMDSRMNKVAGVEVKFVAAEYYTLPKTTDANGQVTAEFPEGVEYSAMIVSVPEGYVLDTTTRYNFIDGSVVIRLTNK